MYYTFPERPSLTLRLEPLITAECSERFFPGSELLRRRSRSFFYHHHAIVEVHRPSCASKFRDRKLVKVARMPGVERVGERLAVFHEGSGPAPTTTELGPVAGVQVF